MAENLQPEPASESEPGSLVALLWRDPRLNVFCSLLWLPLGWTIASWAPWLGQGGAGVDEVVNVLAPLTTFLLVAWNLFASVRLVHRSGHTLSALPLTLVQILLFTLLFYQFACHVGAEQYTWEDSPGVREWIVFAVAHAARATDVIDGIEAYGLHIQSIRNVGHLVSLSLILYHMVITVFFLSLFVEWVNRFKRFLWSDPQWKWAARNTVAGMAALMLGGFLFSAFIWPGWRWSDIAWWPVDNALRVVDFLDVLEVYQYRFHKLPLFAWESTLTFACRFLMAILLAGMVGRFTEVLRLRWLAGFALDARELETLRETHKNPKVRVLAERRLARLKELAPELSAEHRRWRSLWVPLAGVGVLLICVAVPWLLPGGEKPAESLAKVAIEASLPPDTKPWQVERVLSALERMGSAGVEAVPILVERESELPLEQRLRVIQTLGFLGPGASDPLEALLEDENESVRLAAVSALRQVGPAAAPALIRGFGSVYPEVSAACVSGIRQHGNADAQRLADNLDPNNVVEVVRLLDEVDPYWERRTSENPAFGMATAARRAGRVVAAGGSLFLPLSGAIQKLQEIGPLAAAETGPLEPILFGEDAELSTATLEAYIAIDKDWHETPTGQRAFTLTVNRFVIASDAPSRRRAAEVLRQFEGQEVELVRELQKTPKKSIAALKDVSLDTAEPLRRFAAVGLVLLLAAADESTKKDAASALISLAGPAREAASAAMTERQPLSLRELKLWLKGNDEAQRFLAIRALGEQESAAEDAIDDLAILLGDQKLRKSTLEALLKIDTTCHRRAAEAWVTADSKQAALGWRDMVTGSDQAAQIFAIKMTPWMTIPLEDSIALLVRQLRPEDSELQSALLSAIAEIDPEGNAILAALPAGTALTNDLLLYWLKHEDLKLQGLGAKLAEKLGSAPEQVINHLLAELGKVQGEKRRSSLVAVSRLDANGHHCSALLAKLADSEQALSLLRAWLSDVDVAVKRFGVMVAGRMGVTARGATPELFSLLAENDAYLRRAVWYALMRVDVDGTETGRTVPRQFDGAATAQLLLGLRDTDTRIREFATSAVGRAGSVQAGAAAALAALLTNDHDAVRTNAARLLKDVSPEKIAEVEASIYERSINQAAQSLSILDRSAATRALDLCPMERRDLAWHFLKRQVEGNSPRMLSTSTDIAIGEIGFTPDSATLATIGSDTRVNRYRGDAGAWLNSYYPREVVQGGLKPAPKLEPEKIKSEKELRAEELAYEQRELQAAKAAAAAQARLDRLYAQLDRAANIADFKAQEAAMNRAQRAIDAELENQAKIAALADAKAEKLEAAKARPAPREKPAPIPRAGDSVDQALATSADGRRMLISGVGDLFRGWDVPTSKLLFTFKASDEHVRQALFSPTGRRLAVMRLEPKGEYHVSILDAESGTRLGSIKFPTNDVSGAMFNFDGSRFAAFTRGYGSKWPTRGIHVWKQDNFDEVVYLKGSEYVDPSYFAISHDGGRLAATIGGRTLMIWDTQTGELIWQTNVDDTSATRPGMAFSPDGKFLVMAEVKSGLRVFNLPKKELLLTMPLVVGSDSRYTKVFSNRPSSRSCYVEFSPDGRRLAVTAGSMVKLWDCSP